METHMRIVLLHTRLSGYIASCLRALKRSTSAEILIYCWPNQPDAPFDVTLFGDLGEIRNRREHSDQEIGEAVRSFKPDVILTSGWIDKGYVKICRSLRKRGVPVIAGCDTQWKGTLRQQIAALTAPWHIRTALDVLWVTGERQAVLGRALGFRGERLWEGYYSCDWGAFAGKEDIERKEDPRFLYVGRYAPEKGLDTLAEAYALYREQVEDPWKLVCAGSGPLKGLLVQTGAEDRGFVQPGDLPALMRGSAAFILPSRFEPWGVVVHEAASAGLPLILSDACGAGVHLLRDLHNGFRFPEGCARSLAQAMLQMHQADTVKYQQYRRASLALSKQYTPELWAETLVTGLNRILNLR